MKPLRVAFLWHQHQPYYRWENEFILPWVRMHAVKDYYDLPCLLKSYPNLKQTFNFAPSLMLQIDEYLSGKVKDRVQILTEKSPSALTENDKKEILKQFFVINYENLIKPHKRYLELYQKKQSGEDFSEEDFLDLQVWYNLAWVGEISKKDEKIQSLIAKNRNFTEEDKRYVLEYHQKVMAKVSPLMKELMERGQVEISCSPEYHPILPLLIDARSALEAMPWLDLSELDFRYPEDAQAQIERGINIYKEKFGTMPAGVWPSEGSLSDATCDMLAEQNIRWAATDEQMLKETAGNSFYDTMKFFTQVYRNDEKNQELRLLFRDRFLSDRIGFVYSNWDAKEAADEFCSHLDSIRNEIVRLYGEDALDFAAVTVILDGENCWEFYKNNGIDFLNHLFSNLSNEEKYKTITCSEAVDALHPEHSKVFNHIHAGSWINANFGIWIGYRDDITAWKMLSRARTEVEFNKHSLKDDILQEVMREIYIAEGSDWFWWYGPEHNAPNKPDFDILFRRHLQRIYELMGIEIPISLLSPISLIDTYQQYIASSKQIFPRCNGKSSEMPEWEYSARFNTAGVMTTMHQSGEFLKRLYIGNNSDALFFRFELERALEEDDFIELRIDNDYYIFIFRDKIDIVNKSDYLCFRKFALGEYIDVALDFMKKTKYKINITLKTNAKRNIIEYTRECPIVYYFV
ncbi:MAG TPA: glycoside hydrolase family 57 protein [Candidatus Kapabacteria bacterium]|jgi:alpha-amylase/alpha-mannosidase (GH57 family)|nr:glycoside hydrolase family 57 protein [Candidatus Kapabacteria bacterium]